MRRNDGARILLVIIALAALVGARLPSTEARWATLTLALACLAAASAAASLVARLERTGLRLSVLALFLLVAIPVSHGAWLAALPGFLGLVPVLLYLHLAVQGPRHEAPRVELDARTHGAWRVLRSLPYAALLAVPIWAPPFLRILLPDRIASSLETQGPAAPLLAAATVAVPLLAAAWFRQWRAQRHPEAAPAASSKTPEASA